EVMVKLTTYHTMTVRVTAVEPSTDHRGLTTRERGYSGASLFWGDGLGDGPSSMGWPVMAT
ncbi:hypothetical protein HAX54_037146, partial [Datura stramonium]|nr:hypothetical protein [Datura stramonium]